MTRLSVALLLVAKSYWRGLHRRAIIIDQGGMRSGCHDDASIRICSDIMEGLLPYYSTTMVDELL
jgi:hypothetical protein